MQRLVPSVWRSQAPGEAAPGGRGSRGSRGSGAWSARPRRPGQRAVRQDGALNLRPRVLSSSLLMEAPPGIFTCTRVTTRRILRRSLVRHRRGGGEPQHPHSLAGGGCPRASASPWALGGLAGPLLQSAERRPEPAVPSPAHPRRYSTAGAASCGAPMTVAALSLTLTLTLTFERAARAEGATQLVP